MDTITKGYLGQLLFEQEMIKRGWELYRPLLENGKIDSIAIKDNKLLRFQIKTIIYEKSGSIYLPVRKTSHNMGNYKYIRYTHKDIDYFIGSDLITEDLYIVPISFIEQYSKQIAISKLELYKNNFDQLDNIPL